MYCSNCGKTLEKNANFCDGCGVKTSINSNQEINTKDGKVFKCPSCGNFMEYDALECKICGHELRGRKGNSSIQEFSNKLILEHNENKIIELIKTFPVPNTREDIVEFMFLASSNFDARFYATNKASDSIAGAWLSKMEQSYQKGKVMFEKESDLDTIDSIYNNVQLKIKEEEKRKRKLTIYGIIITSISSILIMVFGQSIPELAYVFITMLVIGIVLIVKGLKKNKTNLQNTKVVEIKNEKESDPKDFKYTTFNSSGRIVNKNKYIRYAVYFGWFGMHRRYAGQRKMAILYLFTFGLFGFGWVLDINHAKKQQPDKYGNIVI